MKRILTTLTALALAFLFAAPALHASEKGDHDDKDGPKTIQGCLADGDADGWYVLTVQKEDKTKEVQVAGDASFEAHIGHEVALTGTWVKDDEGKKHFAATEMKHIAATCS